MKEMNCKITVDELEKVVGGTGQEYGTMNNGGGNEPAPKPAPTPLGKCKCGTLGPLGTTCGICMETFCSY